MVTIVKSRLFSVFDRTSSSVQNDSGGETSVVKAHLKSTQQQPLHNEREEIFSKKIIINNEEEIKLDFLLIRLDQSCFAWCGRSSQPASLDSIVVGFVGSKTGPVATSILGNKFSSSEDEASALRIARRANLIAVHFSSAIGTDPTHEIRMFAEKCLVDALKS
jgi:hypothetical protein